MYSVVLLAALTTSVDLPDLGGRRGGGCCGCYGGGRHGGCYGGGYGGGYGGCMGMGYGGYGMGYGGCMGMGMGMGYGGCMGMGMGMGYGGCMGMGMGYGGCYGGFGLGGGFGIGGGYLMPGAGTGKGTEKAPMPGEKKSKGDGVMAPANAATIVVELPAEATLLIGGEATTSTGNSRVFVSPELKPGKEYQYTLTAQIVRDGKPVKVEQVVKVSAGTVTPATITFPTTGVAQR